MRAHAPTRGQVHTRHLKPLSSESRRGQTLGKVAASSNKQVKTDYEVIRSSTVLHSHGRPVEGGATRAAPQIHSPRGLVPHIPQSGSELHAYPDKDLLQRSKSGPETR